MGVILFFLWIRLSLPVFSKASSGGLEGDFCGQEKKGGFEGWTLRPLLDYLEGKK